MRILISSDRLAVLRLASSLPRGSGERRALLAFVRDSARKGDIVKYKGKSYRVLWSGSTRYGDRARLQFLDGSKDFWVDLSRISGSPSSQNRGAPRRGRCRGCGGAITNAPHHRAMDGYCGFCAFDEFDM